MMKHMIFHDYFDIRGGGEKLVLNLADALEGCGLTTGYLTENSYELSEFPEKTKSLNLPSPLRRSGIRLPALCQLFSREAVLSTRNQVRIFSGVAAPFAATKANFGLNLFYCHTPPRFLFDQKEAYQGNLSPINKIAAPPVMRWYEARYRRSVEKMDVIVANSKNVQSRILKHLGKESTIVFPPVETGHFTWRTSGNYYLSNARLTPLKRVDQIVDAFTKMPDKRLIVASGGTELDNIRQKAEMHPNIEVIGWVDEETMRKLVGESIATIYIPVDEDFGMSPVESMAAGKPVLGVAEGGLLETVVHEETGILLNPTFHTEDIIRAVNQLSPTQAEYMREACEKRAEIFTRARFEQNMKSLIEAKLQSKASAAASS